MSTLEYMPASALLFVHPMRTGQIGPCAYVLQLAVGVPAVNLNSHSPLAHQI